MAEETKDVVKKTMCFLDGFGHTYVCKCEFPLHNGVFNPYDCQAVQTLKYPHIVGGRGNWIFVQAWTPYSLCGCTQFPALTKPVLHPICMKCMHKCRH